MPVVDVNLVLKVVVVGLPVGEAPLPVGVVCVEPGPEQRDLPATPVSGKALAVGRREITGGQRLAAHVTQLSNRVGSCSRRFVDAKVR